RKQQSNLILPTIHAFVSVFKYFNQRKHIVLLGIDQQVVNLVFLAYFFQTFPFRNIGISDLFRKASKGGVHPSGFAFFFVIYRDDSQRGKGRLQRVGQLYRDQVVLFSQCLEELFIALVDKV